MKIFYVIISRKQSKMSFLSQARVEALIEVVSRVIREYGQDEDTGDSMDFKLECLAEAVSASIRQHEFNS